MNYNWQQADWPNFYYELASLQEVLFAIAEKTGLLNGKISHLNNALKNETLIDLMVDEAIMTSEIEGEYISRPDVRSSIVNIMGLNSETLLVHDKRAEGLAKLMLDVRDSFQEMLTSTKLFAWHYMLMANSANSKLQVARWRTHAEPMQIISGHHGKSTVHFEAPPSKNVPEEMKKFIHWFNNTAPGASNEIIFAPVRAAIAHLYFESIHPFEDGNGRIGRAISEKALSQGLGYPVMLSLSKSIEADKKAYYAALNNASRSNEITEWIRYFVNIVLQSQIQSEKQINFTLKKAAFFDHYKDLLNERQLKVVHRILRAGDNGFEGGMSAKKYMAITGTSKATATRDLQQLVTAQVFKSIGSGRSVRYELNLDTSLQ
jgi:Fic family protein